MRPTTAALILVAGGLAGCSGADRPVPVSGTVKTKTGTAVTGVLVVFFPVDGPRTRTRAFPLDAEGAFRGEACPGTYTLYLSRLSVDTDEDGKPVNPADAKKQREFELSFRKVPPPYRTPDGAGPDRRVEVTGGATYSFTLDGGTNGVRPTWFRSASHR